MSTIALTLHTLAGVPDQAAVRPALDRILAPFLHLGMRIDGGPTLSDADGLDALHAHLAEQERGGFTARGASSFEALLTWHDILGVHSIARTGTLSLFADSAAVDVDALVEATADAVAMLSSPLAVIEHADGPLRARRTAHRDRYQDGKVGLERTFDLACGLSGLAWRTILGPSLVAFFGTEQLGALGPDRARETSAGCWVIALGDDIEAPDDETPLIEALGRERFFDPATGALPTVLPTLPDRTPLPHRYRHRTEQGDLVWAHFGAAAGVSAEGGGDPVDTWNAMRDAYMESRSIGLCHGYVPEVIVIRDPASGDERRAFVATPEVAYVVPDVDVVLAGSGNNQRLIRIDELDDALASFASVPGDHSFTNNGVEHTCGLAHRTDDDNEHGDALRDALASLGTALDPSQIERVR